MRGLTVLYGNQTKKIGAIIALSGLLAVILEKLFGFLVFSQLSQTQHYELFRWIMLLGLLVINYSKLRNDDERIKQIRNKSVLIAFAITISLILSLALVGIFNSAFNQNSHDLLNIATIGLLLYLMVFYSGVYFDNFWSYEDKDLKSNFNMIKTDSRGLLLYFLIGISVIFIVYVLILLQPSA